MTAERDALVKLATEYWRLLKLTERALVDMQAQQTASLAAQLRYSLNRLQTICSEGGLRLITYDREVYEPNLPVTIANDDEASYYKNAVVDRTVEPTIICDGQVAAMGKVFLKERA
jgi:hypothetical protein